MIPAPKNHHFYVLHLHQTHDGLIFEHVLFNHKQEENLECRIGNYRKEKITQGKKERGIKR